MAATVDPRAWGLLKEHVLAASANDAAAFAEASERAAAESLATQRLVGLYVIHLLKYCLFQMHGRIPSADDLVLLAKRTYPSYASVLDVGSGTLRDTLLAAFKLLPKDCEATGTGFTISALAALGVLMPRGEPELEGMRSYLADWCARRSSEIEAVMRA